MSTYTPKRRSRGEWIVSMLACGGCYVALLALLLFAVFGPWVAEHVRWVS